MVIPLIVGFCKVEVKPLGPLQFHEVAPVALPDKDNVAPAQTGLGLADADTPVGAVSTVTAIVAVDEPQALLAIRV